MLRAQHQMAKDVSETQNSNPKNETKPKRVYKELDTLD